MGDESPAPLLQVCDAAVGNRGVDHDAGNTSLCTRRMFKDEVLNVDARLAKLAEESPKRARLVGNENLNFRVARRSTAVLTRNTGHPLVTSGHDAVDGPNAPTA